MLSKEYIQKHKNYYEEIIKELTEKEEYNQRRCQRQQKEIKRLNNIINECAEEILKELEENHHLSYGVALRIRQKLIDYRELKEKNESRRLCKN